MSDWHDIESLIMAYAERVDLGDFVGAGALFAHATYRSGTADDPRSKQGAEEVRATLEGLVRLDADGSPRTKHVTTNVVIDVRGDSATSRSYFTVLQQTDVLPLQPIVAGRYHDRFEKVDGAWRFADRMTIADLVGDLSQHLRVDLFAGG